MAELLIELFSEEIPARMQVRAADDLKRLVTTKLAEAGLAFQDAIAHSTPRRLTLAVTGLPVRGQDQREERKGPRVGSPDAAVQGFLRGAGLTSLDQCEQRDTGKGVFWFAVTEKSGELTANVVRDALDYVLWNFPWPKVMRWGTGGLKWVRPLHSILAVFDGQTIPGGFDFSHSGSGVISTIYAGDFSENPGSQTFRLGNTTRGHRFLAPDVLTITDFADYQQKLADAFVVLDREARKARILEQANRLAVAEGLTLRDDPGLLEEVAGLVEWPVGLIGTIDQAFMDVPAEVLTTSMRTHQRYFALETADGKLAPRFILMANRTTEDSGRAVVAGNERVLRARLSDAKFFWDLDRKVPLEDQAKKLADVTFHAKLGTTAAKVHRVEGLAAVIARAIHADVDATRRAARLAKADLVTGLVGEFPEVQGVVGRYIAYEQGESAAVAEAIADHYKPLGPSDSCPTAPVSVAVALADKIDILVAFFGIDEKPTGSRDPYALRRAALGVIRLVVENGLRVDLSDLFLVARGQLALDNAALDGELLAFFADRLVVALREKGVRHDLIAAALAGRAEGDLVRLLARVDALAGFVNTDDGANLLAAFRRAANILRIEEKKDGHAHDGLPDAALLQVDEEKALAAALDAARASSEPALAAEDYVGTMAALASLRGPVDAFFDKVTVNADDPALRANRLRLLAGIRRTLNHVADFSVIEG
ncbi:glycine--tRNA ligase subunit beta [Nitrospirillum sp. BR 11164]|uniref:glycine--tRNA ligase subunit beta n=1 Tax=Nitrospirillum sp. BR 11164 TaxID=3104324 RepID=UPI002AFE29CC|nr:glycine--tRNA ligase subunit beta [Nitrospirillum sp. BR 11164]MEA1651639.1 glycine--tRNA ligase subunit beta [Nitrospirillum sp. BR 11164]